MYASPGYAPEPRTPQDPLSSGVFFLEAFAQRQRVLVQHRIAAVPFRTAYRLWTVPHERCVRPSARMTKVRCVSPSRPQGRATPSHISGMLRGNPERALLSRAHQLRQLVVCSGLRVHSANCDLRPSRSRLSGLFRPATAAPLDPTAADALGRKLTIIATAATEDL